MTQYGKGQIVLPRLVLGLLLGLMSSGLVWGQAYTSLSGVVTDPTGAVVPGGDGDIDKR